ncbi:hypothetical protein PISMIDRAFT_594703 [Pisolithus microcarpus 441]|uniref:Uncharacterized protein n=1 Tax=Pisolithus microcarpus 441 TaxID=765257 RepID=A0A0C9Y6U9_9AGAM|nr:hypothetical protein PISMIDRAFT_594703 [Pisolithus microcarpus 441]
MSHMRALTTVLLAVLFVATSDIYFVPYYICYLRVLVKKWLTNDDGAYSHSLSISA